MSAIPDYAAIRGRLWGRKADIPSIKRDIWHLGTLVNFRQFDGIPACQDDVRQIIVEVLTKHNMRWSWVASRRRPWELVDCRAELARRLLNETGLLLGHVAAIMNRDHTSILNLLARKAGPARGRLPNETVLAIRRATGKQEDIAAAFGVRKTTVADIRLYKRYGFVE
jgi:hypothetical protein